MQGQNRVRVVVIGGGPGGYVAAIRAAQLGAQVTLVEKNKLGGTCLNVGCIPTKTLLHVAELLEEINYRAKDFGVDLTVNKIDWLRVQKKKESIISLLVSGISNLMKVNKIDVIYGQACLLDEHQLLLKPESGKTNKINFDRLIIASGSVPEKPPIPGLKNNDNCIDSTGALSLTTIPGTLLIIGGGVIGIEMAGIFSALGTKVIVIEASPSLLPMMDSDTAGLLQNHLKHKGVKIYTDTKVTNIISADSKVHTVISNQGKEKTIITEKVLYAVGRRPNTLDLALDNIGVKVENGAIVVNEYMQTTIPHIYAIGDCLGQVMLAHVASQQGEIAAGNALGNQLRYDSKSVPSCIYTLPELASVGLTETMCQQQNIDYETGKFPLSANGKALIMNGGIGLVKIIIDKKYKSILGVHILGPRATDLIAEASLAIELEATTDDLIATIHAHPTISEAIKEGILASERRAIHIPNKSNS